MVIKRAGIAEIIRASQKDEFVITKMEQAFEEIILHIFGPRFLMNYKELIKASMKFIYFGSTTLHGSQTLGEEYTGIIQVNGSMISIPSFMSRLIMVFIHSFGAHLTTILLNKLEKEISVNDSLRLEAKSLLLRTIYFIRKFLPVAELLHKAIFFYNSKMFDFSKRITNIHYVLVRYWLKDRGSQLGFRLIGALSLSNFLLNIIHTFKQATTCSEDTHIKEKGEFFMEEHSDPARKCTMCLNALKYPAATMCGHVFCWYCIHNWLQDQEKCPICRETVVPARVIPLMNY